MPILIGLIIGGASGMVQFLMLSSFTGSITGGAFGRKAVFVAAIQFLLPFAVLLGCAFLINGSVLWAGIGMTVSLSTCALVRFLLTHESAGR